MADKTYVTAQELLDISFQLGLQIFESGYRPDFIIGVWRGGAPVAIAVQEFLGVVGLHTQHCAIRTSSYVGIEARSRHIEVGGLDDVINRLNNNDSLLIVDDVFDTGLSVQKIVGDLRFKLKGQPVDIKVATPYFKPANNQTDKVPDFYVTEKADWLVFPHELQGLTKDELSKKGLSDNVVGVLSQHTGV